MARSLLVAPAAEDVGLARTCLGLLRALDRIGVHVDYVKPVAQPRADGTPDRSAARVAAVTTLRPPEPLSTAELERQLGEGELDVILEKIVATWAPIYNRSDVVVVEGLKAGPSRLYATALNQALARALDADVLLVGNWPAEPDGVEGLAEQFAIAASGYTSGDTARVVGCVVHGLPAARPSLVLTAPPPAARAATAALRTALARHQLQLIAAVPHRPELTWPRVADLVRELNPEILHEGDLSRRIKDVAVFAQGIPGGIRVLDDGRLIVVPGDRHEVVMAACLAALNGTRLAALLLSAGIQPDPQIWRLTRTAFTGMPVLLVESDSYQTATRVRDLDPGLPRRRRGPDRGRDQQRRRRAERVLAAVPGQPGPAPPAHPRRLPLPGGGASPRRRCAHRPARRDRTPYASRRGRVRRPRHRPLPAARRARRGGRAGQAPRAAAARRRHHRGPADRRRALRRPAGRTAPAQGLDRGGGPRAPGRPGHGRHHDAQAGRGGRPGVRRGAHHREHRPARRCRSWAPSRAPAWCPRSSSCACPTGW